MTATMSVVLMRDVLNSLALGVSALMVVTWFRPTVIEMRRDRNNGQWQMMLSIWLVWAIVMCQRVYSIFYNLYDRPEWMANSAFTAFWPFAFSTAGFMALAAPGVRRPAEARRSVRYIVLASVCGGLLAGILIGLSVSSNFY